MIVAGADEISGVASGTVISVQGRHIGAWLSFDSPLFGGICVTNHWGHFLNNWIWICVTNYWGHLLNNWICTRGVESKSLEVGKSLKIGKNRIKSEKSEFIFY